MSDEEVFEMYKKELTLLHVRYSYGKSTIEKFPCSYQGSYVVRDSVTTIGERAFSDCKELTHIEIPDSVEVIRDYAFANCISLTELDIPDNITRLGERTLYSCTHLKRLHLPDHLKHLGRYSLKCCTSLEEIELPEQLETIGFGAFEGCESLKQLHIPASVREISEGVVMRCDNLECITVSADNPVYDSRENCNGIIHTESNTLVAACKSTVIPDGVTAIGAHAFSGNNEITEIHIPEGVTTIGHAAFCDCKSLKKVYIPDGVTKISKSAFLNCPSLTEVRFPDNLTTIESFAFAGCPSLTKTDLPSEQITIDETAFRTLPGYGDKVVKSSRYQPINFYFKDNDMIKDCVIGSLMAGAAGDALGYPVEFMSRKEILSRYGEKGITEFETGSDKMALVSDDTQMTMFTANGLLWGLNQQFTQGVETPIEDYVKGAYADWYYSQTGESSPLFPQTTWLRCLPQMAHRRAPGTTCMNACENLMRGVSPLNNSKGCGGIMRVAPMGLYAAAFEANNGRPLYDDLRLAEAGAKIAMCTHQHPLGYLPAALMTLLLARLVPLTPEEVKESIEEIVQDGLDTMMKMYGGQYMKDKDYLKKLTLRAIDLAKASAPDDYAIGLLGEGWTAEEAWAISLYCAIRYIDSIEDAIIAAVNHNGDSDSTGSITGNIMGAIYGHDVITKERMFCPKIIYNEGRPYIEGENVRHESLLVPVKKYFEETLELHDIILALAEDLYTASSKSMYESMKEDDKKMWNARYCSKVEFPEMSHPELLEYLKERFSYSEDMCYSLERYPESVSVARDCRCQFCGGTPIKLYFRSEPVSWACLAGREGPLTICLDCGSWDDFVIVCMS